MCYLCICMQENSINIFIVQYLKELLQQNIEDFLKNLLLEILGISEME